MDLRRLARLSSGLAVPPRCAICALACDGDATLCARCEAALRGARGGVGALPGVEVLVWATAYAGTARALVSALKFGRRLALAAVAAEAIVAALPSGSRAPEAVVAVPAASLRRRWRGFDSAEVIAAAVAARLGAPIRPCLSRADHRRQVGRPRAARLASPPRIRARARAPGRALLIDDVLTTGATLSASATALRGAGAARVDAAVFSRALGGGRSAA